MCVCVCVCVCVSTLTTSTQEKGRDNISVFFGHQGIRGHGVGRVIVIVGHVHVLIWQLGRDGGSQGRSLGGVRRWSLGGARRWSLEVLCSARQESVFREGAQASCGLTG